MKKLITFAVVMVVLSAMFFVASTADAGPGTPPDQPKKGLIYRDLEPSNDKSCARGFKLKINGRTDSKHCSHGPDAPLAGYAVAASVPPVSSPAPAAAYTCDGNGTTGKRVQVLYVHASDVVDRYSSYQASFQTWAAGMDDIFNQSAVETGGTRHIRFVHGADCKPTIINVQISASGDDTFSNMVGELESKGYNRSDRKYVAFVDAAVYCGIGDVYEDDQPGANNVNNFSLTFARIDNGCWSDVIPAHELMHGLGGVQLSAPHSTGGWHCTENYDRMCYSDSPYYPAMVNNCPDNNHYKRFDCGHDDYYSTNPPAGSYLATHWNSANSVYLIGAGTSSPTTPQQTLRADSNVTGVNGRRGFTPTSNFNGQATVTVAIHVVDQNNKAVKGVTVNFAVNRPNGTAQCTLTAVTNDSGTAMASCSLAASSPTGTWNVHITSLNKAAYAMAGQSVSDRSFNHN